MLSLGAQTSQNCPIPDNSKRCSHHQLSGSAIAALDGQINESNMRYPQPEGRMSPCLPVFGGQFLVPVQGSSRMQQWLSLGDPPLSLWNPTLTYVSTRWRPCHCSPDLSKEGLQALLLLLQVKLLRLEVAVEEFTEFINFNSSSFSTLRILSKRKTNVLLLVLRQHCDYFLTRTFKQERC